MATVWPGRRVKCRRFFREECPGASSRAAASSFRCIWYRRAEWCGSQIDEPESIQVRVGFYFTTDSPPEPPPTTLRLGRQNIDIRPGDPHYVVSDSYVLPVDVEVHSVQPHAHYLAKEIKGLATLPDGTQRWLIYIKDWILHWQDVYRFGIRSGCPEHHAAHGVQLRQFGQQPAQSAQSTEARALRRTDQRRNGYPLDPGATA